VNGVLSAAIVLSAVIVALVAVLVWEILTPVSDH